MRDDPRFPSVERLAAIALLSASLAAAGCAADRSSDARGEAAPPGASTNNSIERGAQIYGAVIRRLVQKDHTFGEDDPGFRVIYVVDGPVEGAGDPRGVTGVLENRSRFSRALKARIRAKLRNLPPLRFVDSRSSVVVGRRSGSPPGHVRNHGVLLTLGPLKMKGARVQVGSSLWINGLAGQWLTYVVVRTQEGWRITGTTGPVAIS